MILFLFLSHLAVGIVFTLAIVSREAGVKFFRFNAGLAAVLLAVAFAFRNGGGEATAFGSAAVISLAVAEAAVLLYWATVGRALASIRPAIVATACAAGPGLARGRCSGGEKPSSQPRSATRWGTSGSVTRSPPGPGSASTRRWPPSGTTPTVTTPSHPEPWPAEPLGLGTNHPGERDGPGPNQQDADCRGVSLLGGAAASTGAG